MTTWFHRCSRAAVGASAALVLLFPARAAGQAPDAAALRSRVRAYRMAHDVEIVREFSDLLAIPNLASDSVNIRRNAARVVQMLEQRGMSARLLESPGSPPAVYGELRTPGATRTVVFYAHYDGQPVDTAQWTTPPWTPTLRERPANEGGKVIALPSAPGQVNGEWRLYARSAGDDKAPIVAMLTALDALRAAGTRPSVNLKFFFEGEEEAGSPHLSEMLARHKDLLTADLWVICDGPVHQSRRQQVLFGVRGITGVELTVYGPSRALHSGHYGNWAPNPIVLLSNLVASMRDDDGHIRIAGFYDDVAPITAAERRALATVPAADSALKVELQLAHTEAHDALLAERIMLPALNLRGFQSGNFGALAANAIPTTARASIDIRLVPHETPEHVRELVEAHARKQGFYVVHAEPTPEERRSHAKIVRMDWEPGYPALRTSMALPVSRAFVHAVELALGGPVIQVPTLGGSLDAHAFDAVLHRPLIFLPIANHDDNQHAANENLRLQNLWDGIELFGGVMAELGSVWEDRAAVDAKSRVPTGLPASR